MLSSGTICETGRGGQGSLPGCRLQVLTFLEHWCLGISGEHEGPHCSFSDHPSGVCPASRCCAECQCWSMPSRSRWSQSGTGSWAWAWVLSHCCPSLLLGDQRGTRAQCSQVSCMTILRVFSCPAHPSLAILPHPEHWGLSTYMNYFIYACDRLLS